MRTPKPDLFTHVIERRAEIPGGTLFSHGGRTLAVVKAYGSDPAAPVIVEELISTPAGLKGQFGLWSADGVSRALRKKP